MPFPSAHPITGSFMPQWGTRESPRPSLQPQKPPLPRGALAWLGRGTKGSETRSCRESLSRTLTLTFPVTKMETKSLVHTADHGATAEPEAPTRPILPSTATSSPKEQAAGTPRLRPGRAGAGGRGTQGEGVPEDRPYLRARLLTSASAPPSPETPDAPTKRSPSKCLAGKGAQRQS